MLTIVKCGRDWEGRGRIGRDWEGRGGNEAGSAKILAEWSTALRKNQKGLDIPWRDREGVAVPQNGSSQSMPGLRVE